jgi:hypothetical protein
MIAETIIDHNAVESERARFASVEDKLAEVTAELARVKLERDALATKLDLLLSAAPLPDKVLACGVDYVRAFGLLRQSMPVHGDDVITATFQDYLTKLRKLLLEKPEEQGRGHFGSLEANKSFSKQLNEILDQSNLRLLAPIGGIAKLNVTAPKIGSKAGYFQFSLAKGGSESASEDEPTNTRVPTLTLVTRPPRKMIDEL